MEVWGPGDVAAFQISLSLRHVLVVGKMSPVRLCERYLSVSLAKI